MLMEVSAGKDIVLCAINSRYMHTAFGLRYLYANLGELQARSCIEEFTIHQRPLDIAEKLLSGNPGIIGFGVYIWNVAEVGKTVAVLRQVAPDVMIVLGGPEVGFSDDLPPVCDLADYVIAGAAEKSFRELCEQLLSGERPARRFIQSEELPLEQVKLPYRYYTDEDIQNRLIYVEASRGCPFKCEFCLSSLDKTSKPFELSRFLDEMDGLHRRGARNFKFIDRTFNLKVSSSVQILEFFLERMSDELYLHFEVVPDNLPDRLKQVIQRFPEHALQFEIGVQTFDEAIQQRISRKQNNAKTRENLRWLREHSHAYIHADLIFGLPGDTLENFATSFNELVGLRPHEIQLGILKRLRGVPLNRYSEEYGMRYNPEPPYNILATRDIDFATMQRVNRFARFWDMIANSGRFTRSLPLMLGDNAFENFLVLSDRLYERAGSTWKIALKRLFVLLYEVLRARDDMDRQVLFDMLSLDYSRCHPVRGEKQDINTGFRALVEKEDTTKRRGVANRRQRQMLS